MHLIMNSFIMSSAPREGKMKPSFLPSRTSWSSSGTRVMHDPFQATNGNDPIILEIWGKEKERFPRAEK